MLETIKNKLTNEEFRKKLVGTVVITTGLIVAGVIMHEAKEALNEKLYGGQIEMQWNTKSE